MQGKPYVRGTQGPNSFDCSGALTYATRAITPNFPRLTANDIYNKYTIPANGQVPGTLIFYDYGSNGTMDHVATIVNSTQILHPSSGDGILEIQPIHYLDSYTTDTRNGAIYYRQLNWDIILNTK